MTLTERDYTLAPCLRQGPLARSGRSLVRAARRLGTTSLASTWRAWTVPVLYDGMDRIFRNDEDPIPQLTKLIHELANTLRRQRTTGWDELLKSRPAPVLTPERAADLERLTGEHFSCLFEEFSSDRFFEQPLEKFCTRIERNGVSREVFRDKEVLDAGCGAGRFSAIVRRLGARKVVGLDISPTNVETAKRYVERAGMDGLEFRTGSVLDLPFEGGAFDIVLSAGVLHHTLDWKLGITEMLRVLRRGGIGLIMYFNEDPGGLFWDVLEIGRVIMQDESHAFARRAIESAGIEPERIIQILDPIMAPINVRVTTTEIEECLTDNGARNMRRFERGADTDRVERVYQRSPHAREKYGIGDNRYIFEKA
jgi:2-polyprenyl-3-methyl-5-hydroxy-6-metoxy-1,4-benzoquinol methylase